MPVPRLFAGVLFGFSLLGGARMMAAQDAPFPPTNGDAMPVGGADQQKSEQPFRLSVTARVVTLDVVVVDKHGKVLDRGDLKREDFTIYEDGKSQQMRSFEAPSAHRMPASDKAIVNSAADLKKIGDAPVTVLVLDELNSRFEDSSYTRYEMVKYLQTQPAVLREPTVLMVAQNTTFQQLHDYTQDRDALIDSVKKHMPQYPWRMMNSGKNGPGAVERMAQVLAALQQIAQASTGTPGRKNLVWVGPGFPSSDLTGLDEKTADTITDALKRVTNRMLAARITMYSINPAPGSTSTVDVQSVEDLGLSLDENYADPFGESAVAFTTLATTTGGKAFRGRNDIDHAIAEGIAAGDSYYSVTYTPSDSSSRGAKYRHIKVRMRDPELRAVTRDGYYPETAAEANPSLNAELKPKQRAASLQMEISGALTSTIAYNGLAVAARYAGNGTYEVKVAEAGLTWAPNAAGVESAEATVVAAWYDAKGKILGHVAREQVYPRDDKRSGAVFALRIVVPAGAVRLRILARDAASGRMGTVDITKF